MFLRAVGEPFSNWYGRLLDLIGESVASILTTKEKKKLGVVYLDMVPTIFEFNAITCAVEKSFVIVLPGGILMLPAFNAFYYQAMSAFDNFARITNADWRIRLRANLALDKFGKPASLKALEPLARAAVLQCVKAIKDLDTILRVATLGTASDAPSFPRTQLDPECWRFSEAVGIPQWRFVVAHEIGHILAGDCRATNSSVKSLLSSSQKFCVYEFPSHELEIRADLWAAQALRRDSAKRLIGNPIDLLFFLIHCVDETAYFYQRKAAAESRKAYPPKLRGDHPSAEARRKHLACAIGRFDGWKGSKQVFDWVIKRRERELTLANTVRLTRKK